MSKIFDLYTKDKDGNDISRTWYKSSNITYSECVDYDNKPKTLRVVFNNGTQYEYKDVQVMEEGIFVFYDGEKFTMKDNKDNVICEREVKLTEKAFNTICSALEAVGKQLYTEGKNFIEDKDNDKELPFEENNEEAPF